MKEWVKKHKSSLILASIFLLGFGLLAYPSVSDYWNSFHQSEAIMKYSDSVSKMSDDEYEDILKSAKEYNQSLTSMNWHMSDEDDAKYNAELNFNHDGSMGYIDIPKIDVKLTIYHGTDESVLQKSIGHLAGTSLPVGGVGTHSVLSGHRGLPSAKLFSDLDKLHVGDTFTVHILNETLTYEVDQIRVVDPTDLSDLTIDPNQDYVTLVTCTPYGVNTHRLLVRGHRIANADGSASTVSDALQLDPIYIAPFIGVPICVVLVIYFFVVTSKAYRRRNHRISDYLNSVGIQTKKQKQSPYQAMRNRFKELFDDDDKTK